MWKSNHIWSRVRSQQKPCLTWLQLTKNPSQGIWNVIQSYQSHIQCTVSVINFSVVKLYQLVMSWLWITHTRKTTMNMKVHYRSPPSLGTTIHTAQISRNGSIQGKKNQENETTQSTKTPNMRRKAAAWLQDPLRKVKSEACVIPVPPSISCTHAVQTKAGTDMFWCSYIKGPRAVSISFKFCMVLL